MTPDPFVHLRVASGYSMQYGASHPSALVERASALGMSHLALTDRDGLYGAVRFAKYCLRQGVKPIIGVDLAMSRHSSQKVSPRRPRTPARGGEERDMRHPRVVFLASPGKGWSSLCRMVSAIHLDGDRGSPVATMNIVSSYMEDVFVLLGPDSDLGEAVAAGQDSWAERIVDSWRDVTPADHLIVGATHHRLPGTGPRSVAHAGRMVSFADAHGLTAVLTNDVRMATSDLAPTVDILDAARRLVPLSRRNVDRLNAEGFLKSAAEMSELAREVADAAGRGRGGAQRLMASTGEIAMRAAVDPYRDIGLGRIRLPELGAIMKGAPSGTADMVLRAKCEAGITSRYGASLPSVDRRLTEELGIIEAKGFAAYFLTVSRIVEQIADAGIRCAARGSGAGSLVNYLLGISGVDPLEHDLVMERFLSPLRMALPDIDLDVESARRTQVYELILEAFGGERVACVAMLDTYRVRHAVRDVGAALGLPPREIGAIATAFPHIRAKNARAALQDLPELRQAGLGERRLDVLFSLVESLDGLPRHIALHPCGVLLSDVTLLDRTPVEASYGGFPMSQFDKDDVEDLGFLKLDVLGIRMQSAFAHTVSEISRIEKTDVDIDSLSPFADPAVYQLAGTSQTLGCFQIESPGQRELLGKFGPTSFSDIIADISLFRPGPVKSDMIMPFLHVRQGWDEPDYFHPDLKPVLEETCGVVVYHEQIIKIVSVMTGCSLAEGDEIRRALNDEGNREEMRARFCAAARQRKYTEPVINRVWEVLESFASFGFCKAHAAAFALPTYQSAWLKVHYPAYFLSGVLTHDPGMYPKRLLLEEARRLGIEILGLNINKSDDVYRVEKLVTETLPGQEPPAGTFTGTPDGKGFGIRLALSDVHGISQTEISGIHAGRPFLGVSDFWKRAQVSQPVTERLVLAGAFDELYGINTGSRVISRGHVTRRDLMIAVADLARLDRADGRAAHRIRGRYRATTVPGDIRQQARQQSAATPPPRPREIQLPLDFTSEEPAGDDLLPSSEYPCPAYTDMAQDVAVTGLPEMTQAERLQAELDILGLDASQHVLHEHLAFLRELGVTFSADLLARKKRSGVLVAGVKVATQTPPVRSGRRVIFLTLDDTTGPVDATFFADVQGPYASVVFSSWLLVVQGELRRTGPKGVSIRAEACWDLRELRRIYTQTWEETADRTEAWEAVRQAMEIHPSAHVFDNPEDNVLHQRDESIADTQHHGASGGMGRRRTLIHPHGAPLPLPGMAVSAELSPSDISRKLWHSSPGSSGR